MGAVVRAVIWKSCGLEQLPAEAGQPVRKLTYGIGLPKATDGIAIEDCIVADDWNLLG